MLMMLSAWLFSIPFPVDIDVGADMPLHNLHALSYFLQLISPFGYHVFGLRFCHNLLLVNVHLHDRGTQTIPYQTLRHSFDGC